MHVPNNEQIPWENSSLIGDFYFANQAESLAPTTEPVLFGEESDQTAVLKEDSFLWKITQRQNSIGAYRIYLDEFPDGHYSALAKRNLEHLLGGDSVDDVKRKTNDLVVRADFERFEKSNFSDAFSLYRKAADRGSVSAMASLASLYASGQGVGKKNLALAKVWANKALPELLKLAKTNHVYSQYQLGELYANVLDHSTNAEYWTKKAAHQGNDMGMNQLGLLYRRGFGVLPNDKEAVAWFRMAAEKGYANAMYNYGRMYELGEGIEKSTDKARYWYEKSAKKGHLSAQARLQSLD